MQAIQPRSSLTRTSVLLITALASPLHATASPAGVDLTRTLESYSAPASVPTLDTELLATADDPANHALYAFLTEAPADALRFAGRRVAILATDGVEEIELTGPLHWLRSRGAEVSVVAPPMPSFPDRFGVTYPAARAGQLLTVNFMRNSGWVSIDDFLGEADAAGYDALLIPGGAWSPDTLRVDAAALAFVRAFVDAGKPVAAICHGPQVLIDAGVIADRDVTGFWAIHNDLRNAGGRVTDVPVVVSDNVITARFPFDLPPFMDALGEKLDASSLSAVDAGKQLR